MAIPFESGKLAVNGGEVAYRLFSKGEAGKLPIVLVGGWSQVMNDWYALPSEIAKTGRTVLAFDNRCIGESSDHTGSITIPGMAADTLALADALLPRGRFAILGQSAGGFVAQHLAIHSPERIAAAVVTGAQGARNTAAAGSGRFFNMGKRHWADAEPVQALGDTNSSSDDDAKLKKRMDILEFFIDTTSKDQVNRNFRKIAQRSLAERRPDATIQAQFKMLSEADYGAQLSAIKCPVLVMHGSEDLVVPAQNAEKLMADLTGSVNAQLREFPGRHYFFAPSIAHGRVAAKEVESFLAECEGPRSKL